MPVHYFITIDFDGFMDVIEAVDGVEFNVPYDMDYDDPVQGLHIHLKAGQQHLTGQLAHDFVRFRHNNDGSAPGEYVMGDEGSSLLAAAVYKRAGKAKGQPVLPVKDRRCICGFPEQRENQPVADRDYQKL